jgi:hypothetical protein
MHPDIVQPEAGKCSSCGMKLIPEGTRFGMLRHITGNFWMLLVMIAIMLAAMAAAMMVLR